MKSVVCNGWDRKREGGEGQGRSIRREQVRKEKKIIPAPGWPDKKKKCARRTEKTRWAIREENWEKEKKKNRRRRKKIEGNY